MKRIVLLILPLFFILESCSKEDLIRPPIDEREWLNRERAVVVTSDYSCDYFMVETRRGYAILRNWGGASPYPGSVLYGDFSSFGVGTFYNRSEGYILNADVRDYWLTYFDALDQLEWACSSY